jgi:hypothetical protein
VLLCAAVQHGVKCSTYSELVSSARSLESAQQSQVVDQKHAMELAGQITQQNIDSIQKAKEHEKAQLQEIASLGAYLTETQSVACTVPLGAAAQAVWSCCS